MRRFVELNSETIMDWLGFAEEFKLMVDDNFTADANPNKTTGFPSSLRKLHEVSRSFRQTLDSCAALKTWVHIFTYHNESPA